MRLSPGFLLTIGLFSSFGVHAADSAVEKCQKAHDLGEIEGRTIYTETTREQPFCENASKDPQFYWLESFTLNNFLWSTNKYQPISGLDEFQACRREGQSLGISYENSLMMKGCSL